MPNQCSMEAEQKLRKRFRIGWLVAAAALLASIAVFVLLIAHLPDRTELGPRRAALVFEPVNLGSAAPLRMAGAWRVTSADPRFGGISALALEGGKFLALTDSGVLVRFAAPAADRASALLDELPDGPGRPTAKRHRDSEALARDSRGRGWWVTFENRNQAWLYDQGFARPRVRVDFGRKRWRTNVGLEGAAPFDGELLLFPENNAYAIRFDGRRAIRVVVTGLRGRVSEAAAAGELLYLIERKVTPLGFANAIVRLRRSGEGFAVAKRWPLPLGPVDNAEAMAVDNRPGGPTRLWLMTDDNKQRPMRTLLLAIDLPPGGGEGA